MYGYPNQVKRGWTHPVGIVKTSLLLALAVSVVNLNRLVAWAARNNDTRDPLTQMDTASYGHIELGPDGMPLPGNGPPAEAA